MHFEGSPFLLFLLLLHEQLEDEVVADSMGLVYDHADGRVGLKLELALVRGQLAFLLLHD